MTKLYSIKGLQALLICLSLLVSSYIQAQVPSYVPTDGLVGYWPFNGNANDESGNGNDGTVNGASSDIDRFDNPNQCYKFNKSENDFISGNISGIYGNQRTISLWMAHNLGINAGTSSSENEWLFAFGTESPTEFLIAGIYTVSPSLISFGKYNSPLPLILTTASLTTGWIHYVFVQNGNSYLLYVNGVLFGSYTSEIINTQNSIGQYVFGKQWVYDEYLNARLDDIGIWNRALTQSEIQALYIGCSVAPTTVAGSVNPFTLTSSDYACNNNPGSTYEWTITNGVITAGQGTSNVTVLWGEEGAGTLTVVETNTEGCSGTPATIEVTIECATTATTLDGPSGPNALTETTYTCNGSANSTFEWTISNGVITSGQGTNSVTVLWAATGLGSISVQETTNANCLGDLISINVVVIPTSIDELNESNLFLYPNPAKEEITLQTNQSSIGSLYIIVDQTGKQIASGKITGTNTTIKLDQFASGMYTIIRDGKTSQQFQVIK